MAKRILFAAGGRANVRETRTAADVAGWDPDNLSAGEISAEVVADDVTFHADDWEDVHIVAQWAGTPGGSEEVTIQPLRAVWKATAPGRDWVPFDAPVTLNAAAPSARVAVNRGDTAFRISSLTLLLGADDVTLLVTSGLRAPR